MPVLKTVRLIVFAPDQFINATVLANSWNHKLSSLMAIPKSVPIIVSDKFSMNSFSLKKFVSTVPSILQQLLLKR